MFPLVSGSCDLSVDSAFLSPTDAGVTSGLQRKGKRSTHVHGLCLSFVCLLLLHVYDFYAYLSVCAPNTRYLQRPEEGARSTESEIMDRCKPPHGC